MWKPYFIFFHLTAMGATPKSPAEPKLRLELMCQIKHNGKIIAKVVYPCNDDVLDLERERHHYLTHNFAEISDRCDNSNNINK